MQNTSPIKLILLSFCISLCFVTCKKAETNSGTVLQKYFETSVLNQNIIVNFASDSGTDITSNYTGYTFVLLKTDYYHGPLQVTTNGTVTTGSWSCNDDYSKLTITLPGTSPQFAFLSRSWRFTSKSQTVMKLAPWGSTAPLILYMQLQ